jgi:hypothetical protein
MYLPEDVAEAADHDGDGLADDFEQELLARFVPTFMVSAGDCDGLPAEFRPGSRKPVAVAKNGIIYGQVFRNDLPGRSGAFIEIHYYHLWSRDCGRMGHALDSEYVSVLIEAEHAGSPAAAWKAIYWHAAAHQDTACDVSHAVKASALGAEQQGPTVWISHGKHASFLSREMCGSGCGGDRCDEMIAVHPGKLVNIGEPGKPLNGAVWTESPSWPLAAKMEPDFTSEILARIEDPGAGAIVAVASPSRMRGVASAGNSTLDAVATGHRHTEAAVSTATEATDRSVSRGLQAAGRSIGRARRAVARWLRGPSATESAAPRR